jgi:sarcosine oxidase, subunit gamma
MTAHRLKPVTALGESVARVDIIGSLRLAENPGIALASMACRQGCEAQLRATFEDFLGFVLPGPARLASGVSATA